MDGFGDVRPAFPVLVGRAGDGFQRFDQAALHKFGHPEAVKGHEVVTRTGFEVEGIASLEFFIAAAELDQLNGHVLALGLHLILELGNHVFQDPFGGVGARAADHAAADDGELDGGGGWRHGWRAVGATVGAALVGGRRLVGAWLAPAVGWGYVGACGACGSRGAGCQNKAG